MAEPLAAVVLLVVLAPLMLVIALSIRLTSPGSALYRQLRVGRFGQEFRMWKFRTMYVNADERLHELLEKHGRDLEPMFKVPDDPRITGIGRILRRLSLDELPQLINVVRGDMSFVGPRPHRPAEVAMYTDGEFRRLLVRPGITGLWQISGRSEVSWAQAVQLDLRYVDEWSLALDAKILLRTVPAVLGGRGAW